MGRKSKAVVRKQEILTHFYEVLQKEGFENASIAKVAASMDVNPSLLIHYFKTKEEMVVELVDFFLTQYESAFVEDFRRLDDVKERFEKALDLLFGVDWLTVGNYSVFYACFYLASRHERIHERFAEMYKRFHDMVAAEAKDWIAAGLVARKDASEIAEYLIILVEGLGFYQRLQPQETWAKRAELVRKMAKIGLTKK